MWFSAIAKKIVFRAQTVFGEMSFFSPNMCFHGEVSNRPAELCVQTQPCSVPRHTPQCPTPPHSAQLWPPLHPTVPSSPLTLDPTVHSSAAALDSTVEPSVPPGSYLQSGPFPPWHEGHDSFQLLGKQWKWPPHRSRSQFPPRGLHCH